METIESFRSLIILVSLLASDFLLLHIFSVLYNI
jgi:hypothetical protein